MKPYLNSIKELGRQFRLLGNFVVLVYRRFKEERCFQLCGSLTFTTMLALVPLITIMATVMTAFPVFDNVVDTLKSYVASNLVPEGSSKLVTMYMQQFADNAARLTALGIVLLGVSAIMLMLTIDRAFNTIWRVKRPRSLIQRVLIYWSVLTIGPMLIGGSLSLTSWLVSQSLGLGKQAPEIVVAFLKLGPMVMTSIAFGFLYRTVPNRRVPGLGQCFAAANTSVRDRPLRRPRCALGRVGATGELHTGGRHATEYGQDSHHPRRRAAGAARRVGSP